MITDLPRRAGDTAPCAFSRNKSENANPPNPSDPIFRKLRRDIPSQNCFGPPLKKVNIDSTRRQPHCSLSSDVQQHAQIQSVPRSKSNRPLLSSRGASCPPNSTAAIPLVNPLESGIFFVQFWKGGGSLRAQA